jgi:hypothetical protein
VDGTAGIFPLCGAGSNVELRRIFSFADLLSFFTVIYAEEGVKKPHKINDVPHLPWIRHLLSDPTVGNLTGARHCF